MKNIYELELHEEICVPVKSENTNRYWCLRVPNGWLYSDDNGGMSFVPFNSEYEGI